jgi:RNA polymerase sigma factor (sigma-70 family)
VANERAMFYSLNERQPTIEELRSIMLNKYNINVSNDEDLYINDFVYVDDNVADTDDDYTIGDTDTYLKNTSSYNEYEDTIEQENTKAIVLAALSKLDDRTQTIVKMLYGIDCDREYSASELAEMYGMTKTRINQIKNEAQKRLEYMITA